MKHITFFKYAIALVVGFAFSVTSQAYIVDFSQYTAGRIIDSEYATGGAHNTASTLPAGYGFTVAIQSNNSRPNIGVLYNTNKTGGWDADLEGGSTGSLYVAGNQDNNPQGNMLIIQNAATASEISAGKLNYTSGRYSGTDGNSANDSAYGGTMTFSFEKGLVEFGFNWIDLDAGESASITFLNSLNGAAATIAFSEFVTMGSDFYRVGVVFGDHTANQIANINLTTLGSSSDVTWGDSARADQFDQVRFNLNSSGGVSAINFVAVPEPGTVAAGLLLVALAGFGWIRQVKARRMSMVGATVQS